jgi:Calcineurin-like phosphoesterase
LAPPPGLSRCSRLRSRVIVGCLLLVPFAATPSVEARVAAPITPVIAAAGDIACAPNDPHTGNECHDARTAALIADHPGITDVLTLGDNQYERGTLAQFTGAYDRTWGQFKRKTHPSVGNHEYLTANAQGYRRYFGYSTGRLWYSFNLGAWHIVALDSNCEKVGGCSSTSPQGQFLRTNLQTDEHKCELLFWHHPRFTRYKTETPVKALWTIAYNNGVDVILNGHSHAYERYAPQRPSGLPDGQRGIREFVVGTGGKNHAAPVATRDNLRVTNNTTFGILRMTLEPGSYDWRFVPDPSSGTFTDAGAANCH